MLALVLCLLCLPLVSSCPAGCSCSPSESDQLVICSVSGSSFRAHVQYNEYARITCLEGPLKCDVIPPIPVSPNRTLSSLSLEGCTIPRLSCLLAKLGATGVTTVTLTDAREELKVEHVQGLQGMEYLYLHEAAAQTSVPYEVLSLLPSLRHFRLLNGNLTLHQPPALIRLPKLVLDSDEILDIPAGVFEGFEDLMDLSLKSNKIRNVSAGSFKGLRNLRVLNLSRNPLTSLPPRVFADTPRLVNVTLHLTELTDVHAGVFTGLMHLQKIKISKQSKFNLTLHPRSFAELPALQTLIIDKTALTALPVDLLSGSGAIKTIELDTCSLTRIPLGIFEDQTRLEYLNLKSNKITRLDPGLFQPLTSLKSLNLYGNQITVLPENVFAGLTNLLQLDLDFNRLTTIEENVFQGPRNLQKLSLRGNQLTLINNTTEHLHNVKESPFSKLYKLRVLDLSSNQISQVFDDWRVSFIHSISLIDLSWNRITELKENDTFYIGKEPTVDLRHNSIRRIELAHDPHATATLLLGDNPFNCDCYLYSFLNYVRAHRKNKFDLSQAYCAQASENLVSLEEIPLTSLTCSVECPFGCNCTLVPASSSLHLDCTSVPSYYPNITTYNVTNIKLKLNSLHGSIKLPPTVTSLNLTRLGVKNLPEIPNTIQELDLSYNQLSYIPKEISVMKINLFIAGNPLRCSCFQKDSIKSLLDARLRIIDGLELKCENGKAFLDVNANGLCDIETGITIASISLIVTALIIASVYYYTEEIKLFIYHRGWNIFIYEEDFDGKEYDVLISYDDAQERLVYEKVVPNLERLGYSVYVKYKHWDIGDFIPTIVARSVSASRRVLVVMSNTYIESLAILELKAARKCEDKDKKKRVLFMLVEELNPETKLFLGKSTCIKFEDKLFWERMQKHLPRRRLQKERKTVSQRGLNMIFSADGSVEFELIPKKTVRKP